jgi:hypothetical protein
MLNVGMPSGETLDEQWSDSLRASNSSCVLTFLCALFRASISLTAVSRGPHVLIRVDSRASGTANVLILHPKPVTSHGITTNPADYRSKRSNCPQCFHPTP